MTDFRALCAELVHLNEVEVDDWTRKWADAVKRTKAALAQPVPVAPTDVEIDEQAATLIPWLLEEAIQAADCDQPYAAGKLTLAAQLLGELRPTAKPEPQGPSDEELDELFTDIDQGGEVLSWRPYARAVLARWGRPAIEPVPKREGER
jgi:hypothetical protein